MIGDGHLQLTEATPGAQTWLAALNANMTQLDDANAWRYLATLGEAVSGSNAVGLDPVVGDGKFYLADSNHASRFNAFGICLTAGVLDDQRVVLVRGKLTVTGHGFTPGALLYLSETAGVITNIAPTTPRIIGMVLDANTYWIDCPRAWAAT